MIRSTYDITITGTAGGETVARGRYRLKGRDKYSAVAKALRLFRRDFPERRAEETLVHIGHE